MKTLVLRSVDQTRCRLFAFLAGAFEVGHIGYHILPNWQQIRGWEAYWIAQSIAAGQGFSWSPGHRWLFDADIDEGYHLTAWVDPLYTYLLGAIIWIFGEYHQLAAAILNLLFLALAFFLTYRLGERLISPAVGVIAVLLLALEGVGSVARYMNNGAFAIVVVVGTGLLLLRYHQSQSLANAVVLGVSMGIMVLGNPSTQLFVPVTVALILVQSLFGQKGRILEAAVIGIVAVLVVAPWTIRNQIMFEEFVPVRNGAGHLAFVGIVAAAGTLEPGTLNSVSKPWSATGPRDTMNKWREVSHRRALEAFQKEYANEIGGTEYRSMNEAKRDKWLLNQAKLYAAANPRLSLVLSVLKLETFVRILGTIGIVTFLLAAIGGLIVISRNNTAAIIFTGWVAAYAAPFLIIICYFSRYRFPIEPIIAVLAAIPVHSLLVSVQDAFRRRIDLIKPKN